MSVVSRLLLPSVRLAGEVVGLALGTASAMMRSRSKLLAENLALRQQVMMLRRTQARPRLLDRDRWFWIAVHRWMADVRSVALAVTPATIVRWHRAGFRVYWARKSRSACGRPAVHAAIARLARRMRLENPTWGAPRIHAELCKLGFAVSERTVSRYLRKRPRRSPDEVRRQSWRTFLANHREAIGAMDFFTVPTVSLRVLSVWFVVSHDRRRILHFDVTEAPTSAWVAQQLREAFPFDSAPRYLVFDGDPAFRGAAEGTMRSFGIDPKRTAPQSPWQNGVAERWVGTIRRELTDHVIPLDEAHLRRLIREYVAYYNEDRCHLTLGKDPPTPRPVESGPVDAKIVALPRVGGLHHRYTRKAA